MSDQERKSQATLLVELALGTAELELFHNADGEAFVMLPAGTHLECWPLRGGPFRRWLARMFYDEHGKAAGGQGLADALGVLEGKALFRGDEHEVHLRLAEHDGAIYIDLGDAYWQAIKITISGWEVVQAPPIRFRRPRGMRHLPSPAGGGSLDELRGFVNVSDDEWPLLAGWLVATVRPRGPYPVLQLHGEQGSAKSTTARVLRSLVDPNAAPLRSEPRDGRDLMIAARNGWVVGFDNVSHLASWLSDAVCRLSTGGGFATRELFTDTDEILIDVQRPVVMNGIEELAVRGDLLDRSIVLYLPRIDRYRAEDEFWTAFEEAQPRILGALLDAAAAALANVDHVHFQRVPRMADFALWATAAEPALGLDPGAFLDAYADNRADANALSLEASPLTDPLRVIAARGFEGTATELMLQLDALVDETVAKRRSWPKSASALAGSLRRLAPNLRATGVDVAFDRTGSRRLIVVRTGTEKAVIPVIVVTDEPADDGDDADDGDLQARSHGLGAIAGGTDEDAKPHGSNDVAERGPVGEAGAPEDDMSGAACDADGRSENARAREAEAVAESVQARLPLSPGEAVALADRRREAGAELSAGELGDATAESPAAPRRRYSPVLGELCARSRLWMVPTGDRADDLRGYFTDIPESEVERLCELAAQLEAEELA